MADSPVLQFKTPTTWRNGLVGKSLSSTKGIMKFCTWRVIIPLTGTGWGSLAGKQLCRNQGFEWTTTWPKVSNMPLAKIISCLLGYNRLPAGWERWSFASAQSWWETSGAIRPVWGLSARETWTCWSESSESPWRSLRDWNICHMGRGWERAEGDKTGAILSMYMKAWWETKN